MTNKAKKNVVNKNDDKQGIKVRHKPSDSEIYQTLFKAIHEHHLLPDTHLPEDDLAKSFGVSRTRIRKVLEQLIHEQLVIRLPNKGCFVASMSEEQIHEVFEVRKILETGLIDLLDLPLPKDDLEQLQQLCFDENQAIKDGNYGHANTISGEFHIYLALLTDNETLALTIKHLIARTSLAIAIYSIPTTMKCDNGCHLELIDLLGQSNHKAVKKFMSNHLDELEKSLLIQSKPKKAFDFSTLISNMS